MNRARFSVAATFALSALSAGLLAGQATPAPAVQAPPMKSVLAGKKLTPPARGEVIVEFTKAERKAVGDMIQTSFQVKNVGLAPIARLTITQTWFDKSGAVVGGGKGVVNGLLQPGEIQKIVIESPKKPDYNGDSFNFTHANGTVKPKQVAKLTPGTEAAPEAAAPKSAAAAPKKK
jgi:hypothetical protein